LFCARALKLKKNKAKVKILIVLDLRPTRYNY
jgi:hypothetical protein